MLRGALYDGLGIGLILPGDLVSRDDVVPALPSYRFSASDVRLGYLQPPTRFGIA